MRGLLLISSCHQWDSKVSLLATISQVLHGCSLNISWKYLTYVQVNRPIIDLRKTFNFSDLTMSAVVGHETPDQFRLVHTMPEKFETVRYLTVKNLLQDFDAKKCAYTLRIDQSLSKSIEKCSLFIIVN